MTLCSRIKTQTYRKPMNMYLYNKVYKHPRKLDLWSQHVVLFGMASIDDLGRLLLEKFIPFILSYTKDYFQVKEELEDLGILHNERH